MNKLKEYLEQQLNDYREFIVERAKMYLTDCNNWEIEEIEDKYDLYNLDMDQHPINLYDNEDISNHSFDLGGYYVIKNVLKQLKKRVSKVNFMEQLKPVICKMAEEKVIEDVCEKEGYIGLNIYNDNGNIKSKYQELFDKYYDELYNTLNVF